LKRQTKSILTAGLYAIPAMLGLAAPGLSSAGELTFHLVVENGAVAGGAPTLRATEGDDVAIALESDDGMEIHLHGYDIAAHLVPGETVSLVFRADIVGRFPAETHDHGGSHRPALFYLEVHPN
jgi:hypothetical protein